MPVSIQIKDPFILNRVKQECRKSGETTLARTATRLLTERLSQLDYERRRVPAKEQNDPDCAAVTQTA